MTDGPGDELPAGVEGYVEREQVLDALKTERLRAIGVPVMAGRRTALIDLAAQMPAAVLADSLGFRPATAARWRHQAGADRNQYAAGLARERNHQPRE